MMEFLSLSFNVRAFASIRNRHFLALDIVILLLTPAAALFLRISSVGEFAVYFSSLLVITLSFLLLKLVFFYFANLYKRYWLQASIDELARIALIFGTVLIVQYGLFFLLKEGGIVSSGFPRSIPLIECLLAFVAVGGSRFSIRVAGRIYERTHDVPDFKPVLMVGAGEASIAIASELQGNDHLGLKPVVFVDDDPEKIGLRIRGLNVEGSCDEIPVLAKKYSLECAIIAITTATGRDIRRILEICSKARLKTKMVPGVSELLSDEVNVRQLRNVRVEDLLRREPVRVEETAISETVKGARVLVTGGGGSIGSELCRQLLTYEPESLLIVDHCENSVYEILSEFNMRHATVSDSEFETVCKIDAVIADVRSRSHLERIFKKYEPNFVFHAAAYKHVPLLEDNVCEAITNNVLGTLNLLKTCDLFGVSRFVMLSSDKAVNPSCVMGSTKRIAELLVKRTAGLTESPYVSVRFGNVLGSRGSVIPLFLKQLQKGGPLTITDPDMTRYFMSIPEASQLVLQASMQAKGGETYVLDMGDPIRIIDLAEDLIRLSGLEPGVDIDIEFTGVRPGEKLTEELFLKSEWFHPTRHEKVLVTEVIHEVDVGDDFIKTVEFLIAEALLGNEREVLALLKKAVPELSEESVVFRPVSLTNGIPSGNRIPTTKEIPSGNGIPATKEIPSGNGEEINTVLE